MARTIMFIPIDTLDTCMDFSNILRGVLLAIKHSKIRSGLFIPIAQICDNQHPTTTKININTNLESINLADSAISAHHALKRILSSQIDILMEEIFINYKKNIDKYDTMLVQGLMPSHTNPYVYILNTKIAQILNAEIILVGTENNNSFPQLKERITLIENSFNSNKNKNVIGIILNSIDNIDFNKININDASSKKLTAVNNVRKASLFNLDTKIDTQNLIKETSLPLLGYIPWSLEIIAPLSIDLFCYLHASPINQGKIRPVTSIIFCINPLEDMLEIFQPGALLVIPSHRLDMLLATCLAALNDICIAGILLTDSYSINKATWKLCRIAFQTKLAIFQVTTSVQQTISNLNKFILAASSDNVKNIERIQTYVAHHVSRKWVNSLHQSILNKPIINRYQLSAAEFKYQLTQLSQKIKKRIILPEGEEPRIIQAATMFVERNISSCILLGNPKNIKRIASQLGIELSARIQIINPEIIREKYVDHLVELRQMQGMTKLLARHQLKDNVILGTMMLERNEVDGLVSGSINTTANTIRPALQLIKKAPKNLLVSSVFFMLLPKQVLVYGDCAINRNPNPEELAEIAIQSAHSAIAFGIEPRIAMISYSTGDSGSGDSVEKVMEATHIVKKKRPDLLIDGPLQYDAAIIPNVAQSKAPNSLVAGQATIFIFPDLNTGNTTYKAVQHATNINAIGPMLQGLGKPVNDLSRSALVEDILYTIALTVVQASKSY
ncbi:phosphate acetyltransferase [Candidatus Erwinia haradaeae]|uniref:Phosphate acetyltransferase n=1 Tax=Candidatus Erwinia haradaeae TaxID=1922217 RepID=A0A451D3A2_9GAMM|nr:phosphate acetyltransferase [Candidatus Erwinia haradaeae]VFP80146.1 Phosphate acetyltransferase [Candidatus Erwinia haradaeae]